MEPEAEAKSSNTSWPSSHDTALCLIPPQSLWPAINRVRSLNDKAYGKWPPHINLVYPFVPPAMLSEAAEVLEQLDLSGLQSSSISIDGADAFVHRKYSMLYLKPSGDSGCYLPALVNNIRRSFGWDAQPGFQPHLTVGQSEDPASDMHKLLLEKARLLTPISWDLTHLVIMKRDELRGEENSMRRMRVWKAMNIASKTLSDITLPEDESIGE